MVATPLDVLPAAGKHLPLRRVLAVGVGNALEFYNFIAFAFFANQIARTFFPASQASSGLLFTLAFFGLGFFTRPLGAIVIGYYADSVGRKPAMLVSLALMGVSVVGLAFTPSYAQIGIAAPILLLLFRVLQGFALGGEVGPSTALLIEAAPPHRRSLYASIQQASQGVAILTAAVVTAVLTSVLTAESLQAWGWRLAFLLGAAIVPVGLYIRRRLPETLRKSDSVTAFATTPLESWRVASLGLLILGSMTISTYTLGYMTTFAQESLNMTPELAFGAILINGLTFALAAPLAGMLCDRFGRKPVMLWAVGALLVLVIPCFRILVEMRSAASLYMVTGVLSVAVQVAAVAVLTAVTETLPRSVRSIGLGTMYALAIAIFGGSAQIVVSLLVDATGSSLAPAFYMTAALVVGGLAMLAFRTAPRPEH
ncbi:MAG TPA: MFS transporter [Steroidobacteraceae bacterium]|nr:MFS transporter [Steroidobacteraceae bacterium]